MENQAKTIGSVGLCSVQEGRREDFFEAVVGIISVSWRIYFDLSASSLDLDLRSLQLLLCTVRSLLISSHLFSSSKNCTSDRDSHLFQLLSVHLVVPPLSFYIYVYL